MIVQHQSQIPHHDGNGISEIIDLAYFVLIVAVLMVISQIGNLSVDFLAFIEGLSNRLAERHDGRVDLAPSPLAAE